MSGSREKITAPPDVEKETAVVLGRVFNCRKMREENSGLFFHGQHGTLSGFKLGHIALDNVVPINHIPQTEQVIVMAE
jgi:hypothetical protein